MGTTEHPTDDEELEGETSEQNLHAQDHEKAEGDEPAEAGEDATFNGRPETD